MISGKTLANLFGTTFILVGILGFFPNPVVSPTGIFVVNEMHNMVHLLTGVAFLLGAALGYSHKTILCIGVYYVLVAILGFFTKGNMLLGIIHINAADRWLHVMLAMVILASGLMATPDPKKASANVAVK